MDWKVILQIIETVALIVGGFLISYFRTSAVFRGFIAELIADAEEEFSNIEKAGAQKMAWVVEQIYTFVPAWLKPFLTTSKIQEVVQSVFDKIKSFADIQVTKWQAKYDAWKNAKLLELETEKNNSAAYRAEIDKLKAEHDLALSDALIAKINAEAELCRIKEAKAAAKTKK